MIAGRPLLSQLFGVALPEPPIHADLNGLFLLSVSLGYSIPFRDPDSRAGRALLWVMGPFLKGLGAATFVLDHIVRHSPRSFLLFAASDGTIAALTLWALVSAKPTSRSSPAI